MAGICVHVHACICHMGVTWGSGPQGLWKGTHDRMRIHLRPPTSNALFSVSNMCFSTLLASTLQVLTCPITL